MKAEVSPKFTLSVKGFGFVVRAPLFEPGLAFEPELAQAESSAAAVATSVSYTHLRAHETEADL
eukprot:2824130-Amphidinium_carterae.2